jgi:uncharacterized protein with HEPN domain
MRFSISSSNTSKTLNLRSRTYLADQSEEAFRKDRKTQDAVIRNLEIIGEAAGKLPERQTT